MEEKFKLTHIYAPMTAGKSKVIVEMYKQLKEEGKTIECFKSNKHSRYGDFIKSRAYDDLIPCELIELPTEALKSKADVVIFDEVQFLDTQSLDYTLSEFKKRNQRLIFAGLKFQSLQDDFYHKWDNFDLIQKYATENVELKAICSVCEELTELTGFTGNLSQDIRKQREHFKPLCKKHMQWGIDK